jgi:methylmalonyl-CoA epimerase
MSLEIDHLGIAVRSLDEGLAFYAGLLGMTLTLRETVEAEKVHVALLPAGTSSGSPRIELLEAASPDSTIAKFIDNDLGNTVDRLRAAGARLLNEPRAGAGGHTYVFVHPQSAGGVLLELIQK